MKRRNRKLLLTTNTLDDAIAALATIGDSNHDIASGIAATLYANAHTRLPLMRSHGSSRTRGQMTAAVKIVLASPLSAHGFFAVQPDQVDIIGSRLTGEYASEF